MMDIIKLVSETNPMEPKSNLGIEKKMDEAIFNGICKFWNENDYKELEKSICCEVIKKWDSVINRKDTKKNDEDDDVVDDGFEEYENNDVDNINEKGFKKKIDIAVQDIKQDLTDDQYLTLWNHQCLQYFQ